MANHIAGGLGMNRRRTFLVESTFRNMGDPSSIHGLITGTHGTPVGEKEDRCHIEPDRTNEVF
jgi:hypothetical protein